MVIEQGDVLVLNYPYTENSEIKKLRPCLVISNKKVNTHHYSNIIVIPITGRTQIDEFSFNLDDSKLNTPMPKTSQCRCHMIHILSTKEVIRKVNKVNVVTMSAIIDKVKSLF